MKQIIPIGARSLIKPFLAADKSSSGIILDNNSNTGGAAVKGTIIEIGDGSRFKVGDEIYFRRYSMDSLKTITADGEVEVNIVEDDDVLCLEVEVNNLTIKNNMSDNFKVETPVEETPVVVVEETPVVETVVEEAIVEAPVVIEEQINADEEIKSSI